MELPKNAHVQLAHGEEARIQAAVEALAMDTHAPRTIQVTMTLHIHHEYPKHVAGRVVNNRAEEDAALEAAEVPETAEEEAALEAAEVPEPTE